MPVITLPVPSGMTEMLLYIVFALLIAVLADSLIRSLIRVPKHFENRQTRVYTLILQRTITIVVYVTALFFVTHKLGVDITPLLASASIIGIVVGIGARSLIEDLINGFFLLTQDSIAIGDFVKVEDAEGVVEKLGFRSLSVRGETGELHVIPNGQVKKIINYSRHKSYMNIDFPIKSDQQIDTALKAMSSALDELKNEYKDMIFPASEIFGIEEYRVDSRIVLRAKIVSLPENRFKVARRYRYLVKKQFEKNKVALL